jgi:hypothetical protein
MVDLQIHGTIEGPVAAEHELWARGAGRDPDAAESRRPEVVERHEQ